MINLDKIFSIGAFKGPNGFRNPLAAWQGKPLSEQVEVLKLKTPKAA